MKKEYKMAVWSNFTGELEEEYLDWYAGQHVHDLLRIPGFVGGRFYRLASSDEQFSDDLERKYSYLYVWDIETDDIKAVKKDVQERIDDGRTVFVEAFDTNYYDEMITPITKYVSSKEIEGKSVEEVLAISELKK